MTNFSLKSALLSILFVALSFSSFSQSSDDRMTIRLGFTSVTNVHRQILVTVDENSTAGIDFGYDAETFENHQDDMYWMIENRKFLIQGTNVLDQNSVLTIGLKTENDGINTILIDELQNVPEALEIVVYDKETSTYHNIKDNSGFSIDLLAGNYLDRFELRFLDNSDDTNSNDDTAEDNNDDDNSNVVVEVEAEVEAETVIVSNDIKVQFYNNSKSIAIKNPASQAITSVEVYNFNGQLKAQFNTLEEANKTTIQTNNLNAGHYIIVVNTDLGSTSKKILVN